MGLVKRIKKLFKKRQERNTSKPNASAKKESSISSSLGRAFFSPKTPQQIPPLQLTLRGTDETKTIERLTKSLEWHSMRQRVVLTLQNVDPFRQQAEQAQQYDNFGYPVNPERWRRAILQQNESIPQKEKYSPFFAALGRLPLLSEMTVRSSELPHTAVVRMYDLAACFHGAAATLLKELTLSNLTLLARDSKEVEEFAKALSRLQLLRRLHITHCRLRVHEARGAAAALLMKESGDKYWDPIIMAVSKLQHLEQLDLTVEKQSLTTIPVLMNVYYVIAPCLSRRALNALMWGSPLLRELRLVGWNLKAAHIQTMTWSLKWNALKSLTLSLDWEEQTAQALALYLKQICSLETLSLFLERTRHGGETTSVEVLIEALAQNSSLKHIQLCNDGHFSIVSKVPSDAWSNLWETNCTLQTFDIQPHGQLLPEIQETNNFWLTLNGAFRGYLSSWEKVDAASWVRVLSNPHINNNVSALFYVLSNTHSVLIR